MIGRVDDLLPPDPKRRTDGVARAAEPAPPWRRRRLEVVDVEGRDAVPRKLCREPVGERREPAAAVEDDDRGPPAALGRSTELGSDHRAGAPEVAADAAAAETRERVSRCGPGHRSDRADHERHKEADQSIAHLSNRGAHVKGEILIVGARRALG